MKNIVIFIQDGDMRAYSGKYNINYFLYLNYE